MKIQVRYKTELKRYYYSLGDIKSTETVIIPRTFRQEEDIKEKYFTAVHLNNNKSFAVFTDTEEDVAEAIDKKLRLGLVRS
jgi:hypothetical protein